MSDEKASFISKLVAVQNRLKAPKGQYNSFGKYKYRSAEDILEAVKPLLQEYGLFLKLTDEIVLIGERYYVRADAVLYDENGEMAHTTAYAREDKDKKGMDGSQITGTASSYARKYALNGLFLIDDTKDADTDEHKRQQQEPQQGDDYMQPVRDWWKAFVPLFLDSNEAMGNLLKNIGAKDMKSLTREQAEKAVAHMAQVYAERTQGA